MQVPEKVYFVIRRYKDGHEDIDGQEFHTAGEAAEYMMDLTSGLSAKEWENIDGFYIDTATWLHEV